MELWRQKWITVVQKISGTLSILGSAFIIYEVLSDRKKQKRTYFRLMLGMSSIELCDGIGFFLGSWAAPKDWWWWGSAGNHASCQFQAFLMQAMIGSSIYNGFLALYYVLSIRYNWPERRIDKIEPLMHAFTLTFAYGTAIASYFLGIYVPSGNICYIGRIPTNCTETYKSGYTDCERGDNASLYTYVFNFIWLWGAILWTAVAMILIWMHIRNQENNNAKHTFGDGDIVNRKHSKRFAQQGILYVAAFYMANITYTIVIINWHITGEFLPNGYLVSSGLLPLEGFLNFLVYIRPRFINNHKSQPSSSQGFISRLLAMRSKCITSIVLSKLSDARACTESKTDEKDQNEHGEGNVQVDRIPDPVMTPEVFVEEEEEETTRPAVIQPKRKSSQLELEIERDELLHLRLREY